MGSVGPLLPAELVEFGRLTMLEAQLLSRVHPVMRVYKQGSRNRHNPNGQWHFSGHVFNISVEVKKIHDTLPLLPADLPMTVMRRHGFDGVGHIDFEVNVPRMKAWLIYFRQKNRCVSKL